MSLLETLEPTDEDRRELERVRKAALEWINARRADIELPPIAEIPAGRRADAWDCPVQRALRNGHSVKVTAQVITIDGQDYEPPEDVASFIAYIDAELYPELILSERRTRS